MRVIAFRRMSFIATALFACIPLTAAVSGSVSGTVVDDTGKPVLRARVFIHAAYPPGMASRPAGPPVIMGPQVTTAMTDRTGAFIAPHLPNGHYVACAHPPGQGLLNPCHWSASAPEFTIVAGKVTAPLKITLARGAILQIHVNDPHQLLPDAHGPFAQELLFHVVTAKGHHYPAVIVASSKNGRDHSITVPFGTPLTMQAMSPHLVLNDETDKPAVPAGKSVAVPASSAVTNFIYTVSGAK